MSTLQLQGLKAREMIARGNAPGNRTDQFQALKGRNRMPLSRITVRICSALTGLNPFVGLNPGALPRAVILRPFRAGEGTVGA